jgi:hypothetical protein
VQIHGSMHAREGHDSRELGNGIRLMDGLRELLLKQVSRYVRR